jgi:hypothetical protein
MDLIEHELGTPAAEHFMRPGALHVFVRRHGLQAPSHF